MKKFPLYLFLFIASSFFLSACSQNSNSRNGVYDNSLNFISTTPPQGTPTPSPSMNSENSIVTLKTNKGDITISLFTAETPNTVSNFLKKANSGFYNNLIFHRVEPGFVIQGGDPTGTGSGGGEIKSEINDIPFKIGSVGLARTPVTKEISNDSQFFICLSTEVCSQLTGDYVNFGEVTSGMDVVQKIAVGDKILDISRKN